MDHELKIVLERVDHLLVSLGQMLSSINIALANVERNSGGSFLLMAQAINKKVIFLMERINEAKGKFDQLCIEGYECYLDPTKTADLFLDIKKIKVDVDSIQQDTLFFFNTFKLDKLKVENMIH